MWVSSNWRKFAEEATDRRKSCLAIQCCPKVQKTIPCSQRHLWEQVVTNSAKAELLRVDFSPTCKLSSVSKLNENELPPIPLHCSLPWNDIQSKPLSSHTLLDCSKFEMETWGQAYTQQIFQVLYRKEVSRPWGQPHCHLPNELPASKGRIKQLEYVISHMQCR